jgi:hypothetical protein
MSCVIALSELTTVIETLQELKRMHQLNLELLEQLDVVCKWIVETDLPITNKEKLADLLRKTKALLTELYASSSTTKILQYNKLSDVSYHDKEPDDKLPKPEKGMFNSFFSSFCCKWLCMLDCVPRY